MEVLPVKESDIDAVTKLVAGVSKLDILPLLSEEGQVAFSDKVLPDLVTAFDTTRFISLKVVKDGDIIGFTALKDKDYVTHLFVDKTMQGQGIGKFLLERLLALTSMNEIRLRSALNAVNFYQSYGFQNSGEETCVNGIRFMPMLLLRE